MPSIFDVPVVYDLVMPHAPDDLIGEVESITTLLARHGIAHDHILELACGTCPHGQLLTQRGYTVTGLDRSLVMLAEAQRRAATEQVTLHLVHADAIDFCFGHDTFDAAIFMYETFPMITEYDDLLCHFAVVRTVIKHGGLYIIDLDARKHGVGASYGEWGRRTITLPNGSVDVWHEDFPGDWVQGTSLMAMHCRGINDGITYATDDLWRLRVYSPWELTIILRTVPGWKLNGFFSWRDLSVDIAPQAHYFMMLQAR